MLAESPKPKLKTEYTSHCLTEKNIDYRCWSVEILKEWKLNLALWESHLQGMMSRYGTSGGTAISQIVSCHQRGLRALAWHCAMQHHSTGNGLQVRY